jgi:hypothetical protein
VLLIAGLIRFLPTTPPAAEDEGEGEGEPRRVHPSAAPNKSNASADDWRQSLPARSTSVKLPMKMVKNLEIDGYEEKSGKLTRELAVTLSLSYDEFSRTEELFSVLFDAFRDLEASKSELVEDTTGTYVAVASCQAEAQPLFENFERDLSRVIGKDKAAAANSLIRKQLRNGGADSLELGHVATGTSGEPAISKRFVAPTGAAYSEIDGEPSVLMQDVARWRILGERFFPSSP